MRVAGWGDAVCLHPVHRWGCSKQTILQQALFARLPAGEDFVMSLACWIIACWIAINLVVVAIGFYRGYWK